MRRGKGGSKALEAADRGADGPFRSWRSHVEDAIFLMTVTWAPKMCQ